MPARRKPLEQLRRRSRPEEWIVLPSAGCSRPVPKWPTSKASAIEAGLWRSLWVLPVAAWWHEQSIAPSIVARYVRLSIAKPEHAATGQLERELGLTPASMSRLRLVVEALEVEAEQGADPYEHLVPEAKS